MSQQSFDISMRNEKLQRSTTFNETWIYYFTLDSKQWVKQWVKAGVNSTQKGNTIPLDGKVMVCVFWSARVKFLIKKIVQKEAKCITEYYTALLEVVKTASETKRSHFV